ncbi:MAG: hypothetical protein AAGL98_10145 [Planctomycetota bacterium]
MTTVQLKKYVQAKPFKPFTIHLADGRAMMVSHPELISISPGGRTVGVWTHEDAIETIDLLLVTSLAEISDSPKSTDAA